MKNHRKFLSVILIVIIACAAVIAAAVMNMDRILMRVSPEMYISYMVVNTINEIEKEKDMIEEAVPKLRSLSDSHLMALELDTEKHKLKLTEAFDEDKPSVVFNGTYNGMTFVGYINNSETGICLPSLLDVYFTFSTKNFGDEYAEAGGNKLLPFGIPRGMDLTLPSDGDELKIFKSSELMNIGKQLIQGAEIHHDTDNDYYLLLRSENVKTAVKELVNILKNNGSSVSKRFESFTSLSLNDMLDILTEATENAELGETLTVKYTECKNYVSKIETEIKSGDTSTKLIWDAAGGARLLEDMTVSVITESGGSKVGFEYKEGGNRFFKNEEKQDKRELRVIFGGEDILKLALDINYDKANRSLAGSAAVNGVSAELNGVISDDNISVEAGNINNNGEYQYLGSASVSVTDPVDLRIPDKEKYPFKDLKLDDMASMIELFRQGE